MEEKVEVKGETEVIALAGGPDGSSDEPRSVARGARPRRTPDTGGSSPQADCCILTIRAPGFWLVPVAMEF